MVPHINNQIWLNERQITCVKTKRTQRRTNGSHRLNIFKDLILFLAGLSGIAYMTVTGNVNLWLLIAFSSMAGATGFINFVMLLRGLPIESGSSVEAQRQLQSELPKSLDESGIDIYERRKPEASGNTG